MIIVVMGVAGSGKTTIGRKLAAALRVGFTDADELHSPASVEKMRSGIALTDAEREPWLNAVRAEIDECGRAGEDHVFACSALKARYREVLGAGDPQVRFVYLKGDAGPDRAATAASAPATSSIRRCWRASSKSWRSRRMR